MISKWKRGRSDQHREGDDQGFSTALRVFVESVATGQILRGCHQIQTVTRKKRLTLRYVNCNKFSNFCQEKVVSPLDELKRETLPLDQRKCS